MLLANIISHLFAASWWEIMPGSSPLFWCLVWEQIYRAQEEGIVGRVDASNMNGDGGFLLLFRNTEKAMEGWSQCLEKEYYISTILLSALIFAEVIAFILFLECFGNAAWATDSCSIKIEIIPKRRGAVFTHGQSSLSHSTQFLKSYMERDAASI